MRRSSGNFVIGMPSLAFRAVDAARRSANPRTGRRGSRSFGAARTVAEVVEH